MRVTVQRRLGLPLDVACQAVEAGKRAPSGQLHDVLGDAAMVNPRSKHATRHKFLLKRLIKCLRSAWGMIIEMEPTAHLSLTALVSSPSLAVLHLSTYLPTEHLKSLWVAAYRPPIPPLCCLFSFFPTPA